MLFLFRGHYGPAVRRPEVLFLDESTTRLDPEARRGAWTAVENLATGPPSCSPRTTLTRPTTSPTG